MTVAAIPTAGLQEWFDPTGCHLVVTHTAMIGDVRMRLNLPVVNIETFIFERPDHVTEGLRGSSMATPSSSAFFRYERYAKARG